MRSKHLDSPENHAVKSYPVLEGIAIGLLVFLSIAASASFLYYQAVNAVKAEIEEGILRSTSALAATLDGDTHQQFTSKAQKYDAEYLDYVAPLERARQASKYVPYIYTNIMIDDKVFFIVNPSPQLDLDNDGFPDDSPDLMDTYDAPSSSLLDALTNQKVVVDHEPYTDQWGTFISAYAPIYNSEGGFVGTLGMDLDYAGFEQRLIPVKNAFKTAAITGVVMAILVGVTVWYNRRIIKMMSHSRNTAIERFIEANEHVRQTNRNKSVLLAYLVRSFNGIAPGEREVVLNDLTLLAKLQDDDSEFEAHNFDIVGLVNAVLAGQQIEVKPDKKIPHLIYGSEYLTRKIYNYIAVFGKHLGIESLVLKMQDESAHNLVILTELVCEKELDQQKIASFVESLTAIDRVDDNSRLTQATELAPAIFYYALTALNANIDTVQKGSKAFAFSIQFDKYNEADFESRLPTPTATKAA